jgi:hypothetical protein
VSHEGEKSLSGGKLSAFRLSHCKVLEYMTLRQSLAYAVQALLRVLHQFLELS